MHGMAVCCFGHAMACACRLQHALLAPTLNVCSCAPMYGHMARYACTCVWRHIADHMLTCGSNAMLHAPALLTTPTPTPPPAVNNWYNTGSNNLQTICTQAAAGPRLPRSSTPTCPSSSRGSSQGRCWRTRTRHPRPTASSPRGQPAAAPTAAAARAHQLQERAPCDERHHPAGARQEPHAGALPGHLPAQCGRHRQRHAAICHPPEL